MGEPEVNGEPLEKNRDLPMRKGDGKLERGSVSVSPIFWKGGIEMEEGARMLKTHSRELEKSKD